MQQHALRTGGTTVLPVSHNGMPLSGKLHPYLMCSAGVQPHGHQRAILSRLHGIHRARCLPALLRARNPDHALAASGNAFVQPVFQPHRLAWQPRSAHPRKIHLAQPASLPEKLMQRPQPPVFRSYQQQAGGILVQPVRGGGHEGRTGKTPRQPDRNGIRMPRPRLYRQSGGLAQHQQAGSVSRQFQPLPGKACGHIIRVQSFPRPAGHRGCGRSGSRSTGSAGNTGGSRRGRGIRGMRSCRCTGCAGCMGCMGRRRLAERTIRNITRRHTHHIPGSQPVIRFGAPLVHAHLSCTQPAHDSRLRNAAQPALQKLQQLLPCLFLRNRYVPYRSHILSPDGHSRTMCRLKRHMQKPGEVGCARFTGPVCRMQNRVYAARPIPRR